MSTKTSFKRIALVAASALAIAGFSAVPAHAASTVGDVYFGTTGTTTSSTSVAVGTATSGAAATITVAHTSDATPAAVTLTPTLTSKPNGSSADVTDTYLNYTLSAGTNQTAAAQVPNTTSGAIVATSTAAAATATVFSPVINFTPDKPGVYVLTYALTGAGAAGGARSLSGVLTIYAGYSADSAHANKLFPIQGSNISTGWSGVAGGLAGIRVTGLATGTRYYATVNTGVISGVAVTASIAGGVASGGTASTYNLTNGTNLSGGIDFWSTSATRASNASDGVDITVTDLGAATTTLTIKSYDATTGVASTFASATVTWGVAAIPSAQYSILDLNTTTGVTIDGTDTTTVTAANTAATKQWTIQAVVNDQYNAAYNGATLGASITGPGTLGIATTTASTATSAGRSLTVALTGRNLGHVTVFGDGTSGESTITITATTAAGVTTTLGTKTVTWTGAPAKATVTQQLKVAAAGSRLGAVPATNAATNDELSVAGTAAFKAKIVDALGNAVAAGSTVKMTSSDTAVITVGTCAEFTAGTAAPGNFECSVSGASAALSGKSATVTFSVLNAATGLYDIVATPLTFSIGGAIATVVVTTDAASYSAGQAMSLTATAKDSKGNAAYDGQDPYYTDATASKTVQGLSTAGSEIVGGVSVLEDTLFAPATPGDFIISGKTTDTAGTGTAFAVTATVDGGVAAEQASLALDAANAATDAANNAYDEAQNATQAASDALAAVTALAAQVKSLIASVKKLTAAVAKLKK